ncbi:MAG TPA: GerMN domain-containing protein [Candidatus Krumholzibacteria bacterium]|nr:GerMN domain-containing protein [Candidatus Krumholzibacteria bacterium]
MQESDEPTFHGSGGNRRRTLFWGFVVLLLVAAAGLLFWPQGGLELQSPATQEDRGDRGGDAHSVQLYFADAQAQNLASESRKLDFGEGLEENVQATVAALAAGPQQEGNVAVLPREARVEQVFFTEATRTLYLDFNKALVDQHPGGSTAEYLTLGALVRTIAANFPQVANLQLLVEGQAMDTLAGHFDTSKPIEVADWQ